MDTGARIKSLDITRGVAVMGILSVNIVGMAMIQMAYFFPPAFGFDTAADHALWLANFLLVDGKLRSLFSMMFGASTLLVIERAAAAGRSPARTHYARMAVLLVIGYLHWLIFWWGDILTHYAAVGAIAFFFRKAKAKTLFIAAAAFLAINAVPGYFFLPANVAQYEAVQAGAASPQEVAKYEKRRANFFPDAEAIAEDKTAHASIPAHMRQMIEEGPAAPLDLGPLWFETLGLMLLGMGLYKTGFLTGALAPATYREVAWTCIPVGMAAFGGSAWWATAHGHAVPYQMGAYGILSTPFRPIMATGYAALIILLCRRGQASGWWADHVAAVGRAAFSNYLFSTFAGMLIFYGFAGGLYAELGRFQAWLFVPPLWLGMLLWSKWWLDRFHYGPFEWVWRSLSRWQRQPLRKATARPMPAVGVSP